MMELRPGIDRGPTRPILSFADEIQMFLAKVAVVSLVVGIMLAAFLFLQGRLDRDDDRAERASAACPHERLEQAPAPPTSCERELADLRELVHANDRANRAEHENLELKAALSQRGDAASVSRLKVKNRALKARADSAEARVIRVEGENAALRKRLATQLSEARGQARSDHQAVSDLEKAIAELEASVRANEHQ